MEIRSTADAILGFMAGVASATNSDTCLYVDENMLHTCPDGVQRFLPVVAVESGGNARFPATMHAQVAEYFGVFQFPAEDRVEDLNALYGLEPDDAADLMRRSMGTR